jgi:hypothetical protein
MIRELDSYCDLAFDENGTLYLADPVNGWLGVYDERDGNIERLISGLDSPWGLQIRGERVYFLEGDPENRRVIFYSRIDERIEETFRLSHGSLVAELFTVTDDLDIVFTRGNRLYEIRAMESTPHLVTVLDPEHGTSFRDLLWKSGTGLYAMVSGDMRGEKDRLLLLNAANGEGRAWELIAEGLSNVADCSSMSYGRIVVSGYGYSSLMLIDKRTVPAVYELRGDDNLFDEHHGVVSVACSPENELYYVTVGAEKAVLRRMHIEMRGESEE